MKVNRIIALRLMLSVAVIMVLQVAVKSSSKVRQELLAGMSIVKKLLVIKTSSWTWIDFLEEELGCTGRCDA
jgi:hypothetical protein